MNDIKHSHRGFAYLELVDQYGAGYSVQKSSAYREEGEQCIWLGIDDADPQIMASKAKSEGIDTNETTGWVPYPIPSHISLTTRMHLDQKDAKNLAEILLKFAESGELV